MLCDATDDGQAEELCRVLDEVMSESLVTLQLVAVMPKMLASTDLAKVVGALRKHESERVRGLASAIVRRWRASVEDELARVRAAVEKLDQIPQPEEIDQHVSSDIDDTRILEPSPKKAAAVVSSDRAKTAKISEPLLPKKRAPVVGSVRVKTANMDASTKVSQPLPKKVSSVVGIGGGVSVGSCSDEKMAATKRKLHEGYQEAEHAKRQRKIQVIQAPEMVRQKQQKMHPILRLRSRVSCASSMAERTFLMSSLQRV